MRIRGKQAIKMRVTETRETKGTIYRNQLSKNIFYKYTSITLLQIRIILI